MHCSILHDEVLVRDRVVSPGRTAPDPVSAAHREERCAAHGMTGRQPNSLGRRM